MEQGLLSVIIVNWNTRDLLLGCIESVRANAGVRREIVVVDNASSDGSAEAVRTQYPEVKLVASEKNLGFAAGNNLGVSHSRGELLLLLNPDTVVREGAIPTLVSFLSEHPEVGMVGPLLVGADGSPQISSFGLYPGPLEAAAHALRVWRVAPRSRLARRFLVSPKGPESWAYVEHLLGACILMSRDLMDRLNGFDEGFFLFLEETELCYRAKRAGRRLAYVTDAEIVHYGEQSLQGILHRTGGLYIRSYNRFCRKHGMGCARRAAVNLFLVVGVLVDAAIGLARWRSARRAWSCFKALYYGYIKMP